MGNDEKQDKYVQIVGSEGTGYQNCIFITIHDVSLKLPLEVLNEVIKVLSSKLEDTNVRCSKLLLDDADDEDNCIQTLNRLTFDIFQLSLDLSDPFHRLELKSDIEIFHKITDNSGKKEDEDESQCQQRLAKMLQRNNPDLPADSINDAIYNLLDDSKPDDEFNFDFDTIYKRVLNIAMDNADKGYYAIYEVLNRLKDKLENYKKQSTILFLQEDSLTPLGMEFKFAIFDEKGRNVAYKKNGHDDSGFEFFIERGSSQDSYDICCVIRDWNNALVEVLDIREETDAQFIIPDEKHCNVFNRYKLAMYRKYSIDIDGESGVVYGYDEYKKNGGKIIIAEGVRNYSPKEGTIKLSGCRTTSEQFPGERKYTFCISLSENESEIFTSINVEKSEEEQNKEEKDWKKESNKRKLRCPYCAQELGIKRRQKKNRYCNGGKLVSKDGVQCKNNNYLSEVVGSDVPLLLPENYIKTNSGIVSLIGEAGSGKSMFISNFFGLHNTDTQNMDWHSTIGPFISNSNFTFYRINSTWNEAQFKVDNTSYTSYSDYLSLLYGYGPKRSRKDVVGDLVKLPFVFKMENSNNGVISYMSFFDFPGEYIYSKPDNYTAKSELSEDDKKETYPVCNCDAYILFIDPTDRNLKQSLSNAKGIMEMLKDEKVCGEKSKQRAVAVVFSKFDLWIEQLLQKHDDTTKGFLQVVRKAAPAEHKRRVDFQGSMTKNYIDACSRAVEKYFTDSQSGCSGEFKGLTDVLKGFGPHKFFLVSALGRDSSFRYIEEGVRPSILYRTKSNYNVDLVALWLAVQLEIIK